MLKKRIFFLAVVSLFSFYILLPNVLYAAMPNTPTDTWVVGKIALKSASGLGYCSMKNTFTGGQTLVFARDASGVDSVAVDFGQKLLTIGAQYQTLLEIGFLSRSKVGVAATAQVLMVKMEDDDAFYQMLKEKNMMQITVGEKSTTFGLSGTSQALDKLSACTRTLKNNEAYADEMDVTAQIENMETVGSLGAQSLQYTWRSEMEKLRAENRRLMEENQSIVARMMAENKTLKKPTAPETVFEKASVNVPKAVKKEKVIKEEVVKEKIVKERITPPVADVAEIKGKESIEETAPAIAVEKIEDIKKPARKPAVKVARIERKVEGLHEKSTPTKKQEPKVDVKKVQAEKAPEKIIVKDLAVKEIEKNIEKNILPSLLKEAGVTAYAEGDAYTWNGQGVFSTAHEQALPKNMSLNDIVSDYVGRAEGKCDGDFAYQTGDAEALSTSKIVPVETACLGGQVEVTTAMLFVTKGQKVVILSHEGPADMMREALTQRDVILNRIAENQ